MKYPVKLTHDKVDGGYVVTFPDIPEAITQGETVEEALDMAREALETAWSSILTITVPCRCHRVRNAGNMLWSCRLACRSKCCC